MPAETAATQKGRLMSVSTPLGADVMLASAFSGHEAVSQLFFFSIDCLVKQSVDIAFDKLLGQPVLVRLNGANGQSVVRRFHGICRAVIQGESDVEYTQYRLEMVPQVWLLTKKTQSRIFQQINVPEILKKVLSGFNVEFKLQGKYEPRDYCVQYRETDWNFASRLMEEEGIYYYFTHADDGHKLILQDTNQVPEVANPTSITYKNVNMSAAQGEEFIFDWGKRQELTSGKVLLWDHCFELPHKHLESEKVIEPTLAVGQANHKLKVANNDKLELYDYQGEYAQRFDGVDPGGGERAGDIQKIHSDGPRTVAIRMQAEATGAVVGHGSSTVRHLIPGHKFNLATNANDKLTAPLKPAGPYIIMTVTHSAMMQDAYRAGSGETFAYSNSFTTVPAACVLRPQRVTPKPVVPGSQTAVVVGPKNEEIFTDKYGRVKVQFHWDREGKYDANSSCWIRVGTIWAGKRWGVIHIPRIGQEVIVDFIEGDPDQPIIVGSVYNADQMPAYLGQGGDPKHKHDPKLSGIKTNTTLGGQGFNELRFDDTKGAEQIFIHGEKNEDIRIKNDCMENIMHDRHLTVGNTVDGKKVGNQNEEVLVDKNIKVNRNHEEHIGGDMKLMVGGIDGPGNQDIVIKKDKKEHILGNSDLMIDKNFTGKIGDKVGVTMNSDVATKISGKQDADVGKDQSTKIGQSYNLTVGQDSKTSVGGEYHLKVNKDSKNKITGKFSMEVGQDEDKKVGQKFALEAGQEIHLKAGMKLIIEAGSQVSIKGPGGFIDIGAAGVTIQGTMVKINSGGSAGSGSGASPEAPQDPQKPSPPAEAKKAAEAQPVKPTQADDSVTGQKSCP